MFHSSLSLFSRAESLLEGAAIVLASVLVAAYALALWQAARSSKSTV